MVSVVAVGMVAALSTFASGSQSVGGSKYISCESATTKCVRTGNAVYSKHKYQVKYRTPNLAGGHYKVYVHYTNALGGVPASYQYRTHIELRNGHSGRHLLNSFPATLSGDITYQSGRPRIKRALVYSGPLPSGKNEFHLKWQNDWQVSGEYDANLQIEKIEFRGTNEPPNVKPTKQPDVNGTPAPAGGRSNGVDPGMDTTN